jgi:hypothetical protein
LGWGADLPYSSEGSSLGPVRCRVVSLGGFASEGSMAAVGGKVKGSVPPC